MKLLHHHLIANAGFWTPSTKTLFTSAFHYLQYQSKQLHVYKVGEYQISFFSFSVLSGAATAHLFDLLCVSQIKVMRFNVYHLLLFRIFGCCFNVCFCVARVLFA